MQTATFNPGQPAVTKTVETIVTPAVDPTVTLTLSPVVAAKLCALLGNVNGNSVTGVRDEQNDSPYFELRSLAMRGFIPSLKLVKRGGGSPVIDIHNEYEFVSR